MIEIKDTQDYCFCCGEQEATKEITFITKHNSHLEISLCHNCRAELMGELSNRDMFKLITR